MIVPDYTLPNTHRWARGLKQQMLFTVYLLPTKENKLPFSVSRYICIEMAAYIYKRKTEAQAIFLYPFTVGSSYKPKLVVCPFDYKETNGSYPFANVLHGLNGLNGLANL